MASSSYGTALRLTCFAALFQSVSGAMLLPSANAAPENCSYRADEGARDAGGRGSPVMFASKVHAALAV
jgi:hypothetical protein